MSIENSLRYNTDLQTVYKQLTGNPYAGQPLCKDFVNGLESAYNKFLSSFQKTKIQKISVKNIKVVLKVNDNPVLKIKKKRKKSLTPQQKRGYRLIKDRMETAKSDMIHHIEVLIKSGEIGYQEFVNDPTVYYDSQIMGVYYNNYIIRKAIVRYFEREFIPF